MKQFMTTSVEQRRNIYGDFDTHPMETGWASEAIFFVRVEELLEPESRYEASVQISVDGVLWIDEGTRMEGDGNEVLSFVRVKHFGGWLRLKGKVEGGLKLSIHLVLKE
ncbi:MAG TPA: hypothetical protein VKZ56_10035 [Membranihabitans sp.]|nr:hypothetical protein [Membranihabitans sp.]